MGYIFRGSLCGYICPECPEQIAGAKVRIYRARDPQVVTSMAVADPKNTMAILTEDQVKAKASSLIAEVDTDASGNFTVELDAKKKYAGEAFEIDLYCESVPRQARRPVGQKGRQLSITTLQPLWKGDGGNYIAGWRYCIPARVWCAFRALFGAWTICGHVTICDTQTGAANLKVTAFDADWLQDDALGTATTNATGHFRIDYTTADFVKTIFSPFINVELTGGPDIYFKIETSGGVVLLNEGQARGRQPDRENAGPCFCVDLCVDVDQPPPFDNPWFTHVGDFHILTDIDATDGLSQSAVLGHGGPNYAFFGNLKLKGYCPKTSPIGAPDPMRYRFLYVDLSAPSAPIPITAAMFAPVVVGSRLVNWDALGTGAVPTFQTIVVAGSGPTPFDPTPSPLPPPGTPWGPVPTHVIVPDAQGWVDVDSLSLDGGFYGPLIRFASATVVPGGAAPGSGAGVLPAAPKSGKPLQIIFEAGPVGAAATFTNSLPRMLINNWSEVNELNLLQFHLPGASACDEITNQIDIEYTVDHEVIAAWAVTVSSAALIPPHPPFPSGSTPRGAAGTHVVNVSTWPSCSYTVSLHTRRSLTDGEIDDATNTNSLTFCK